MAKTQLVGLPEIEDARRVLEGVAVETPLDRSRALSEHAGGDVFIKCENLQRTGSFKIRGAYNRISRLDESERAAGVVAASAGNHAQGVALAATLVGAPATVFMPEGASLPKIEATERYGAKVILTGKDFGAAFDSAVQHAEEHGLVFVPPFDHPDIIAGQGTIGLEINDRLPEARTVVVPVGGGGVISGIAAALHGRGQPVRLVGVQAAG
ncbi:MAG: pyridoxal-phosphate dependent enzyme, partial [Actinomycetota bacterium]|nr:pyridoxal-phosphate dependent enzyme [Actinomycetota bacterium]